MSRITSIMAALLLCAATASANAAEPNWRVKAYLEDAAKLCAREGGVLRTPDDRTVRLIDVNDDGHDDYVIDYRWLRCEGNPHVFCTSDGFCSIDFLAWLSDKKEWKGFLHASVADWRVRKGDKPALLLAAARQFCSAGRASRNARWSTRSATAAMSGKIRDAKYFKTAK